MSDEWLLRVLSPGSVAFCATDILGYAFRDALQCLSTLVIQHILRERRFTSFEISEVVVISERILQVS